MNSVTHKFLMRFFSNRNESGDPVFGETQMTAWQKPTEALPICRFFTKSNLFIGSIKGIFRIVFSATAR